MYDGIVGMLISADVDEVYCLEQRDKVSIEHANIMVVRVPMLYYFSLRYLQPY